MLLLVSCGLSPRVRGNLPYRRRSTRGGNNRGSIPARAGESLVFNHQSGDGNGLVDRQSTTDHALKGPGPPAEV